jgi:hypothetical protein
VRGAGGANSDDWRESLALCILWFKLTARKNVISDGGLKMSEYCRVVAMAPTLVIAWFTDMEVNPFSSCILDTCIIAYVHIVYQTPNL